MKITITVNGKQIEAEVDEKAFRETVPEKKATGYECFYDGYVVTEEGDVADVCFASDEQCKDSSEYETENFYTDKNVAENNARADELMRKLRRFAAEHGGAVAPKKVPKFRIGTAHRIVFLSGRLTVQDMDSLKFTIPSHVVFRTNESAKAAIEAFRDELMWYFTEYDPMPEGWWENP